MHSPLRSAAACCSAGFALLLCAACAPTSTVPFVGRPAVVVDESSLPPVRREFRGVWVATVDNIDWPSKPGLPPDQQRAELLAIFDKAVECRLNAVVLQVRPACDAIYKSSLEPWSDYLTGAQGQAPEPSYDPLEFAVAAAHARGLELHAWFNPFRARHKTAQSPVAAGHISRTRPDLVREYGNQLWLDPGEPDARQHSLRVVRDVVKRYDIDAVHFDDYFYPYRVQDGNKQIVDFPDEAPWRRYQASGGALARDDWRRDNINRFIEQAYRAVKAERPTVRVGISPFGIWRPGNPPQIKGLDAYREIYADSKRWLMSGWVDYFSPQLYWPIAAEAQSFPVLLDWWTQQNPRRRFIWPGLIPSRIEPSGGGWPPAEIAGQIRLTQQQENGGAILFSAKPLMQNRGGIATLLAGGVYADSALPPSFPWLSAAAPAPPEARLSEIDEGRSLRLVMRPRGPAPRFWHIRVRVASGWQTVTIAGTANSFVVENRPENRVELMALSAVDRAGALSPPVVAR